MRNTVLAIVVLLLPVAAFAQQGNSRNFQTPADAGRTLPSKPAARASNPCASFGPGFVRVEGTDTCVKLGGAVSIGGGYSVGR
jgi:hypothetical protein